VISIHHYLFVRAIHALIFANFKDNVGKLIPECQTILGFIVQEMMEVAWVTTKS